MAEGVAANFLPRHGGNCLQQRGSVKAGRFLLVLPDFLKFRVSIQLFIDVTRLVFREIAANLLMVFRKKEAHGGPGGVDAVFLEQLQEFRNGLSAAQNVILIFVQRADIQHPPEQFKIQ